MKKLLLGTVGLAVLAMMAPANAADLAARPYTKAPPVVAPIVTNWSGFYIGGFGGYGWSDRVSANFVGGPALPFVTNKLDGGFGGGTLGFNWQAPGSQFVWGIEVDAAGSDINGVDGFGPVDIRNRINAFGSVTGRIGVAFDSALLYVKGGYGWANNKLNVDVFGVNILSESNTHSGWTIGAGLEYMFAPNWSAKVEYQYYDLGKETYAAGLIPGGIEGKAALHTVKAGVNYHFNWASPVVAKY